MPTPASLEVRRAVVAGDLAPATSVFFGGGTPSRLHPETLCRILDAIPRAPDAEVTVECNPEDADEAHLGGLPAGRASPGSPSASSRPGPTSSPASAGATCRRRRETIAAAVAGAGFATWNLDLIFGAATESDADWAATLDGRPLARAPAPALECLRPHRRARHAAGRRTPRAIPTTTSRPAGTSVTDAVLTVGGVRLGGDLQLGPARARVPAQPPVLGAGRLRGHRVRRALAPRRRALVERADARSLRRRGGGRPLARGRTRGADARPARVRGALARRCAPRAVCPWDSLEDPEELDGLVSRVDGRAVLTVGAGCWPTRSAPESAPVSCTDDRDRRGRRARRRRPDGEGRAPVPRPWLHLPLGRDLRRLPLHLRLRPARGQHAAQRQERLVARRWSNCATTWSVSTPPSSAPPPSGRPRATWPPLPTPWSTAELPRALAGRQDRRRLPQLRLVGPHRGPRVQPDVQDPRRPGGGRGPRRLPAPRDRPGHVHQLRQRARHDAQEAALRHRAGGQVLP